MGQNEENNLQVQVKQRGKSIHNKSLESSIKETFLCRPEQNILASSERGGSDPQEAAEADRGWRMDGITSKMGFRAAPYEQTQKFGVTVCSAVKLFSSHTCSDLLCQAGPGVSGRSEPHTQPLRCKSAGADSFMSRCC